MTKSLNEADRDSLSFAQPQRHLHADNNKVKPKSLVFYPFAYALLDEELANYCWYCLKQPKENSTLKKCSKCKCAYFCDKNCQILGWLDHKVECKALLCALPSILDIEVRMLGRIVVRAKQIQDGIDKQNEDFYRNRTSVRSVMDIWSHTNDMRNDAKAWHKFEKLFASLCSFYGSSNLLDKEAVFELHCRNFINRHAISDHSYIKEIGKGLYLDLCAYDHSCKPNAIYTHDGFVAYLKPLNDDVDISDRTTTFYTYIDLLNCREDRRQMLRESWYFHCECARCQHENDSLLTSVKCCRCLRSVLIPLAAPADEKSGSKESTASDTVCSSCHLACSGQRIAEARSCMTNIQRLVDNGDFYKHSKMDNLRLVENLLTFTSELLYPANVFYVRLLQAAINNTTNTPENNLQMLRYHLQAEECLRLCYPANHPALAYHLMNTGIFCFNADENARAKKFLSEALQMFSYSLGEEHPMTTKTSAYLTEL